MTVSESAWFRNLYDDILQYEQYSLFHDVLNPWVEKAQTAITELGRFKTYSTYNRRNENECFAMWNLYALSRVNDVLLISLQDESELENFESAVTLSQYREFFTAIGMSIVENNNFSPFHHEIARVQTSKDADEPIRVLGRMCPGLMFGDMMFSRSRVAVSGGTQNVEKNVAEKSTLYFTFQRLHRRTNDLSHGWGHNSQWRTSFRRDYESEGIWIYNADGTTLLNSATLAKHDDDGLNLEERIELCRNRCFIRTQKPDGDLSPFDDRFEETCRSDSEKDVE